MAALATLEQSEGLFLPTHSCWTFLGSLGGSLLLGGRDTLSLGGGASGRRTEEELSLEAVCSVLLGEGGVLVSPYY